jgi:hypothetical protein
MLTTNTVPHFGPITEKWREYESHSRVRREAEFSENSFPFRMFRKHDEKSLPNQRKNQFAALLRQDGI